VLGPVVVITTLILLASGVALSSTNGDTRDLVLLLHKASFVVWFAAMTVHVLGHLLDVVRLGPRDWRAARPATAADHGTGSRRWLIAAVVVAGCFVGVFGLIALGPWPASSELSR
jgi:hypothetical protein